MQINYLNHGGGSKDADKLIDEIVANLAEQLQGEMVVVLLFDNCAVGKNGEISAMRPRPARHAGGGRAPHRQRVRARRSEWVA